MLPTSADLLEYTFPAEHPSQYAALAMVSL